LIQLKFACAASFDIARRKHRETAYAASHRRHHDVDGDQAQKGYALNRMCFSFNSKENREAFRANEDAYCAKYGLTKEQREAVKSRNVLRMIEAGGNVYYLAKLAGIFGLNVQDLGAQQTGMSVDAFKRKLVAAGR
jgi:protocatechuate 4,5-dioxygenase alpha chain